MTPTQKRDFKETQELMVNHFNGSPVGTVVRYWKGGKVGDPSGTGPTRTPAEIFLSGHAVVWIEGCSGYVCLTHVELLGVPNG